MMKNNTNKFIQKEKKKNKNRKRQKKVSRLHEKPMTAVYRASTAEELYALSLSAPVGFFFFWKRKTWTFPYLCEVPERVIHIKCINGTGGKQMGET